ncbi:MAG: 50S ribosomal protein L31e [Zestosphaera sp.]
MVEGTIYVINLNRLKWTGLARRNFRAVRYVREFVKKHAKAEEVVIDASINEYLLSRGADNLPARIAVSVNKLDEEGKIVKASLAIQIIERGSKGSGEGGGQRSAGTEV